MPHFYGAVGAPILGGHQWRPHSRRPLVTGSGEGAREARLLLQRLRRGDPRPEYGLRAAAAAFTVLVHALVVFLIAVHRPAYVPPDLPEQMASTEVRLIDKEEPPPPPPPPITLPKRPQPKPPAPSRPPEAIKEASRAAMPPIPSVVMEAPRVQVDTTRPEVAPQPTPPVPAPRAETSPPSEDTTPEIEIASDQPRVVLETSDMALPTPQIRGEGPVRPVQAPQTPAQPVPTPQVDTRVEIGTPALDVSGAVVPEAPQTRRATVEASTPEVPTVTLAGPEVSTTEPTPVQRPDIAPEAATPVRVQAPSVSLAPVPETPVDRAAPAWDLPVADVSEPQAPRVDTAAVSRDIRVATPPAPAEAASATTPARTADTTARAGAPARDTTARQADTGDESWLPPGDRFEPAQGGSRGGESADHGDAGDHGADKGYVQLPPRGNSDVMRRSSDRLGYKPTMFDQYWAPKNESLLDTFLRRFVEKLSVKHTFHLAPGVRVHCVMGPLAIFIGCGGDPPRQASSKSGDQRLDMAPANPLVPGLGTSAPAASRTAPDVHVDNDINCAMARVAGGPPPPGCPNAPGKPSQSDQWHPDGGH